MSSVIEFYYYSHFMEEKTNTLRGSITFPSGRAGIKVKVCLIPVRGVSHGYHVSTAPNPCVLLPCVSSLSSMAWWTCSLWTFQIMWNDLPIGNAEWILRVAGWLFYKGPLVLVTLLWRMFLIFKGFERHLHSTVPLFFTSQGHIDVASMKKRKLQILP